MIKTKRLELIPCDHTLVAAILTDFENLSAFLKLRIPDNWPFFPEAFQLIYDLVKINPDEAVWWTYLFINRDENVLIGSGGYKGPPKNGAVEIGYEVAPEFRNTGYATEAAMGFIRHAFSIPEIKFVKASTLPMVNASNRVLEKCGMKFVETAVDEEVGDVWFYQVERETFLK
ncbi:MAG: GNAT family N-acetyltransferase [Ignavibacteriaceae bacterium]|nr:GNAT family N-acetyltransferase [Ignavibacteriaceae bacterium]